VVPEREPISLPVGDISSGFKNGLMVLSTQKGNLLGIYPQIRGIP
jgi:hypothetical protein